MTRSCMRLPRASVPRTCAIWRRSSRACADAISRQVRATMNKPTLLLAALVLMLGGCSPEHTPTPAAAAPPDKGAPARPAAPVTATGQPPASESANPGEGTNRDEAALERVPPLPAA